MSTLATFDDPVRLAARAGTTLGRPAAAAPAPAVDDDDGEPNDLRTDRLISEVRAKTPKGAMDIRATPRLSVREINELDSEEINRRLAKIKRDDRSPIEQAIDLLDLPRNLVMQAAAPGLARKAKESGNTGTFGLGRVSAADALEAMGVENRIVRGVLGFAGDVLLDPLTYVGPAGWGAQVVGKGGSAALRSGGRKALRRGIAEAAAGKSVQGEVGAYLKAKGLVRQAGEDAATAHSRISKAVYGDISEGALDKISLPFGGDRTHKGGDLANDIFSAVDGDAPRAARAFYEKYGRGSRGIGPVGGSEIAHLPFTDISLRTKPFTGEARMASQTHRLAKLRDSGLTEQMLTNPAAAGLAPDVMRLGDLSDDMREAEAAAIEKRAEFAARRKAIDDTPGDDDGLPPEAGSPDDVPPPPAPPPGTPSVADSLASESPPVVKSEPTPRDSARAAFSTLSDEEFDAGWSVHDAFVNAQARRMGISPEEMHKRIRFQQGDAAKGALEQAAPAADSFLADPQTETPEFKAWFANSKTVDGDGLPLVFYHGTTSDFEAFQHGKSKKIDAGWYGHGHYATQLPDTSGAYATSAGRGKELVDLVGPPSRMVGPRGANVKPIYLSLQNPYVWPFGKQGFRKVALSSDEAESITRELTDAGHDGVLVYGEDAHGNPVISEAVAFFPEQIKSAIGNRGTFDPNSANILEQAAKGAFWTEKSGQRVIASLENADLSTFMHEQGHLIRSFLDEDELAIVSRVYGGMDADLWGAKLNNTAAGNLRRVAEEKFAKDFEKYLATGQLPEGIDDATRTTLAAAFDKIKEFLLDLYKSIAGTPLEDSLHPEIKGVFDRALGGVGVQGKKAGKGPGSFSRADMESQILSAADRLPQADTGVELSEAVADSSGMDLLSTAFYKKLPQEVTDFLQGQPHLRTLFSVTDNPSAAKGSTVASEMTWPVYLDQVRRMGTSRLTRAKQTVQGAGVEAEQARLAAWMHDSSPRGAIKLDKYINPAALADGSEFTIFGHPFSVATGEDGVRMAMGENNAFRLDAIETLPFDPGSMRGNSFGGGGESVGAPGGGGWASIDDLPVSPLYQRVSKPRGGDDVAGQEGMFGQGTYGSGGSQGSLFDQGGSPAPGPTPAAAADDVQTPVRMVNESDADYKARLAMHAKWKESARNTGRLFQNGPDARAAIDMEEGAFESAHAEAQAGRLAAAKQVMERAQAAAASGTPLESFTGFKGIAGELALHDAYYDAVENVKRQESLLKQAELARTLGAMGRETDDSIRQINLIGDTDISEDLWAIAQNSPETADRLVTIAQESVTTAAMQAEILRGAISTMLTNPETVLIERAKQLIGTGDTWIASSVFGPVAHLLAGRMEDDAYAVQMMERFDRTVRNSVGVRGGTATRYIAREKAAIRHAGMRLQEVEFAVRDRVTKALRAAGKDTPENRSAVLTLAWAKAHPGTRYNLWKFDSAGKFGPQHAEDGSLLNPSALTATITAARNNGVLSDPAIAKEIDALVGEFGESMRTMGDEEVQSLIGLVQDPGYVPQILSEEARDAARISKSNSPSGGDGIGEKTFRAAQPFQKQRMTMQTRFQDPGTLGGRRFFEGDRVWLDGLEKLPREQKLARAAEAISADMTRRYADNPALGVKRTAEKVEAVAAAIDYDEIVKANPAFAKQYPTLPTDGMELNELHDAGRFDFLVGRHPGIEHFVETDLAAVWANRTMQHHLARATKQAKDLLKHSYTIDPLWAKGAVNLTNQKSMTATGVPIEIIEPIASRMGTKVFSTRIHGEKYRLLDPDLRTDAADHPILKGLFADASNKMDGRLFEHREADMLEDFMLALKPEKMEELLGFVDTLQGFWKMYTLTHASWPIFNIVGNSMLALMGKANPRQMIAHAKDAAMLRTKLGNPEALRNLSVTIRGQAVSGADLMKQAVDAGVVNNTISLELAAQYARQDPGILAAGDRFFRRMLGPWFRANQMGDDMVRLAAWMSHMEEGADASTAAAKVLDSMFDYSDFTRVEERFFRRAFPFYSWIRSNLGFQMKSLVEQPRWAALAPKLQEAIEESMAGDERVPENLRPRWMRDALATQLNNDPKGRIALMLGQNILPQSDLVNVLAPLFGIDGAQKFAHFLASSASPLLTKPLEVATGRELFSGREIGGDTGWSSFALGAARPVAEFGVGGTAAGAAGALAGQAIGGPIGNIAGGLLGAQAGSIGLGAALGEGDTSRLLSGKVGVTAGRGSIGQAISRANLGGRVQPMDDDRLMSSVRREFKDRERKLRMRIGALQRTNQSTTDTMADLMAMYRDAVRDGLDDVVPKWARASLGGAAAGSVPAAGNAAG